MTSVYKQALAVLVCLALCLSLAVTHAQEQSQAEGPDRVELHQALLDLTNPWTVMCVAAHPDDEDGATLTILRRKFGFHTVTLFSTFGEGGQNVVGPEVDLELGVIRAQETIAASHIQGSEPHFLGLSDFGYSKSAEETFRIWGHEEALHRMVLKIRQLRPDVIITNHSPTGGHGHHQATGRLLEEAFEAAADAKRFPEQLQALAVWQPKRLFVRFGFRPEPTAETGSARVVTIDPNERDPIRNNSYAEQALAGLHQHATQGPWPKSVPAAGARIIRYRLAREAPGTPSLPERPKTFLDGLSVKVQSLLGDKPLTEFIDHPNQVLDKLIEYRRSQSPAHVSEVDRSRQSLMERRLDNALAVASGVKLEITSQTRLLVPEVITNFLTTLSNTGPRTVHLNGLTFEGWGQRTQLETVDQLASDTETIVAVDRATPGNTPITTPQSDHLYDGLLFGHRFEAVADLEVGGAKFSVRSEASWQATPAVSVERISPSPYVSTPATINRPLSLDVMVTNNLPRHFRGTLKLSGTQFNIFEVGREFSLEPYEAINLQLRSNATLNIKAAERRRGTPNLGLLTLTIEDFESGATITERSLSVSHSEARVAPGMRVGYLPSFDKTLETALTALNVRASPLSVENIKGDDLSVYHTLIIDNRGYEAHPQLIVENQKLLDYVSGGGTLIVFYHKSNEWNPDPRRERPQLAPYPIILGSSRVTEEDSRVTILQPKHPLLNTPNRIGQADFNNWVQERGLYYPQEWDRRYQELLATSDKGEAPLRGGLLVTRYGRGSYIYTSMVWYRQLRAGIPGAYRMFANMISYGLNR